MVNITSIEMHPDGFPSSPITFAFRDTTASAPYNARDISGLDSDLMIPKYYGTGSDTKFYNLIRQKRTIVLQIGLNPTFVDGDPTYSDLRDDLYRCIATARSGRIQLRFKNADDIVVAVVNGTVTKVDPALFDKDHTVTMTIECRDPMLKSPDRVDLSGVYGAGSLIFTDDKSTAAHGFAFSMELTGTTDTFTIANDDEGFIVNVRMNPESTLDTGDVIHFSSEFDNKYLYYVRDGVTKHLADRIDLHPVWPLIYPGLNSYDITPEGTMLDISHYETYWGI